MLEQNDQLPGKHRLTGHGIYQQVWQAGYRGSEAGVLVYLWQLRKEKRGVQVFIPLEFEPGQDAQVDWGEAAVILGGEQVTVQLFLMRLCYSRKLFVMAFPSQKQECFLAGHVAAFHFCRLLKDGQVIKVWTKRETCTHITSVPGVYRVEVYIHYLGRRRGWIFSNPIYVKE